MASNAKSAWQTPSSIVEHYKKYRNEALSKLSPQELKKNGEFEIEPFYDIVEVVGRGAYGVVVAAKDTRNGKMIAIKKIQKAFEHKIFAKRTLRELKILRLLKHDNILNLISLMLPKSREDFHDIYMTSELVEGDLYSIIKSPQKLEEDHIKFIIYQILRGLKYQHSANVLHRDLKPRNILISSKCEVKICDYGLARLLAHNEEQKTDNMTDYVATRWYRAPELLLANEGYDAKIDIWSVGCILAEMYLRKPFLMGTDWKNQLYLIVDLLGTPKDSELDFIENEKAKVFLKNYPHKEKGKFEEMFSDMKADSKGLDLLKKMLIFDPRKRISVEEALQHPYLEELYCPEDEPTREPIDPIEFEFENVDLNKEQLKDMIYEEALLYHFKDFKEDYQMKVKNHKSILSHISNNDNKQYVKFEKMDDAMLEE